MESITQIIDSSWFWLGLTMFLSGAGVPIVAIILIKLKIVKGW